MENNLNTWLERMSALYLSQMRQAAANEGNQTVHLEILHYLSICNEYSNTAQALSEYLGQTKGSISQSLKTMEKMGLVRRMASEDDKRVFKLYLTRKGHKSLATMSKDLVTFTNPDPQLELMIKSLLENWQGQNKKQGFGLCETCKYNLKESKNKFKCGLTGLELKKKQTLKICREHRFLNKESC